MDQVIPIKDWTYDPCTAVPIQTNPNLNEEVFKNKGLEIILAALKLLISNPGPDLQAFINLGTFVFRVNPGCDIYISPLYYHPEGKFGAGWVDFYNGQPTTESPVFPWFTRPITKFYKMTSNFDGISIFYMLFWQPVTYLILLIITSTGFLILQKRWEFAFILFPVILQTIMLIFLSPAQQTRYQYGLIVISIYSIALFLWTYYDSKKGFTLKGDE